MRMAQHHHLERGSTLVEYVLLVALVSIGVVAAARAMSEKIGGPDGSFAKAGNELAACERGPGGICTNPTDPQRMD